MINEFLKIAANLKNVPRQGWKNKIGIEHPESVADHSFLTSLIAMTLADLEKLDTLKILRMALLHDIAESIISDLTPDDITKTEKKEIENKTMKRILKTLPPNLANEYFLIWKEYNEQLTEEAKLLHQIDKFEMAIQAINYVKEGYEEETIKPFLNTAKNEIKNDLLKEILENFYKRQ